MIKTFNTINAGITGLQFRTLMNDNSSLIEGRTRFVSVHEYGAIGDGITDDLTAIQNAINDTQGANKVLFFPNSQYYVSSKLNITDDLQLQGCNTEIITDYIASSLIAVTGSLGVYKAISNAIVKGQNWLVSTLLAPLVSPGDIIKIFSKKPLCSSLYGYNEAVGSGEMKVVRNVVGDIIYTDAFEWDYSNADWTNGLYTTPQASDLGAAKVSPIKFQMDGIELWHLTTDYNSAAYNNKGISITYIANSKLNLVVKNFAQYGITVNHAINCDFNAVILNSVRTTAQTGDGSPGYGFELQGTSMYNNIHVVAENVRHAFVYNGNNGVAWGNRVSGIGKGIRTNGTFDCHAPCGSIYFDDIDIIGGDKLIRPEKSLEEGFDPESALAGDFVQPYGMEVGSKYTFINNVRASGVDNVIMLRSAHEIDKLVITNIKATNCKGAIVAFRGSAECTTGSVVKGISINNISGDCDNSVVIPSTSTIDQVTIKILNVDCTGALNVATNGTLQTVITSNEITTEL